MQQGGAALNTENHHSTKYEIQNTNIDTNKIRNEKNTKHKFKVKTQNKNTNYKWKTESDRLINAAALNIEQPP